MIALAAVAAVLGLAVLPSAFLARLDALLFGPGSYPGARDFARNQARYEEVIKGVEDSGIKPGETRYFRLSQALEPFSLKPATPPPNPPHFARWVTATRKADGRLIVVIITRDLGHVGLYGYVYASGPLTRREIGPDTWGGKSTSIKLPGTDEWWVDEKIDDNWWAVYNNLQ